MLFLLALVSSAMAWLNTGSPCADSTSLPIEAIEVVEEIAIPSILNAMPHTALGLIIIGMLLTVASICWLCEQWIKGYGIEKKSELDKLNYLIALSRPVCMLLITSSLTIIFMLMALVGFGMG